MSGNKRIFGQLPDGRPVERVELNAGPLRAGILNLGAILQEFRHEKLGHSLTLGAPKLDPYLGPMAHWGAVMGPVVNRLSNAEARLGVETLHFTPNHGKHLIHGGAAALHTRLWTITDTAPDAVTLALDLPDGDGGFPGNRRITARYALDERGLSLELNAQTDRPTLMNLAHHGYWNLDGTADWEGHRLQVLAERYLPSDFDNLPTGKIAAVQGTRWDFRQPREIDPLKTPKLDNNFCLADRRGKLREAVRLMGRKGVGLTVSTTEPGVQIFDMGTLDSQWQDGHEQRPYPRRAGLAIEPQFWPDAPNNPQFPSIELNPGEEWRQFSRWDLTLP